MPFPFSLTTKALYLSSRGRFVTRSFQPITRDLLSSLEQLRTTSLFSWHTNETLVEAVSDFIHSYHPEAKEIGISDESDVVAATQAAQKKNSQRVYTEVTPRLEELGIKYTITKNGKGVKFKVGKYNLGLAGRTGGRYTLTIWSKTKSTEEALSDFQDSQELSATGSEDSTRRARIPMSHLNTILNSLSMYVGQPSA